MTEMTEATPLMAETQVPHDFNGDQLDEAVQRAQAYLLQRQDSSGYWSGLLEGDASTTAGYIPLMYYLFGWVDPQRKRKVMEYVLRRQNSDGSWPTHHAGPGDLDVSIQCYFALKLAGLEAGESSMQKARDFILSKGGIGKANAFTKIWLAVFGQFDYQGVPSLPPEVIFLPTRFFFNIYEFASWSRETLMALAIVLTKKPVCIVPESASVDELYLEPPNERRFSPGAIGNPFTWRGFFLLADRVFKWYEHFPWHPGREAALRKVESWIVKHQESDGSWGGILLPWIYALFGLRSLGYPLEHPVIAMGIEGFEDFVLDDGEFFCFKPATSPVWDTAWSLIALRESGVEPLHRSLTRAAAWLLEKEIRTAGDWVVKNPGLKPGGWSFEFRNDWYPDLDDSALVPRALLRAGLKGESVVRRSEAVKRAVNWVVGMQSKNGGWGAFDRDNDLQALTQVPFADFLTPLDPTCADVTAHALEFLSEINQEDKARQRGVEYLRHTQETDGSWYGRWGVNYVYGTGLALTGLSAAGEDMQQHYIMHAVDWLFAHQNADGGWGETCLTYSDPDLRGRGVSTASQTAWALLGLVAAGQVGESATRAGVSYLISTQGNDGSWEEPYFTGTGFPRVFYLRYDLYRIYFPLLALGRFIQSQKSASQEA